MSKADKFLEIIGLGGKNNKEEYNDDYFEDDFDDEEPVRKSSSSDSRSRYAHRREVLDDNDDSGFNDAYSSPAKGNTQSRGRVAAIRGGASSNNKTLIIHSPKAYEDSQTLAFQLKQNKQIIVKFDNVDQLLAQRILDFLSGTAFALGYKSYKISSGIILFAPGDFNVEEQEKKDNELENEDEFYSMDDIRRR